MRRALIVGSQGQDGSYLFEQLAALKYALLGIDRAAVRCHGLPSESFPQNIDILDADQVGQAVRLFEPDEIYYLAAFHHAADDRGLSDPGALFQGSYDVHVRGLLNFLSAAVQHAPHSRLFYAASSHVFGDSASAVQDEGTPLRPVCVYGITKTAGTHYCRFFRANHSLHTCVGFLYNHESPLRRPEFLTQKIVRSAVAHYQGNTAPLMLGNLSATVDWGYAPDYAQAMRLILSLDDPDDYVVATGQPHTVRDFAAAAFRTVGLDWQACVLENPSIVLKRDFPRIGNAARVRDRTGWKPSVSFTQMVELLVHHEAQRVGVDLRC